MATIYEALITILEAIESGGSAVFDVQKTQYEASIVYKAPGLFVTPGMYYERPDGFIPVDLHNVYTVEIVDKCYIKDINDKLVSFETNIGLISATIHANRTMDSNCYDTKITAGLSAVSKLESGEVELRCPLQLDCLGIRS